MENKNKTIFEILETLENTIGELKEYLAVPSNYGNEGTVEPWTPYESPKNRVPRIKKERTHKTTKVDAKPDIKAIFKYKPVPQLNTKLYLGEDSTGNVVYLDMKENSNTLITGTCGTGKTRLVDVMLTNIIKGCTADEPKPDIYIIQVHKSDLSVFDGAGKVKKYADDIAGAESVLKGITDVIAERQALIKPFINKGSCSNIYEFNDLGLVDAYAPVYLVIDDFISLIPYKCRTAVGEENKYFESGIFNDIKFIAQYGRNVGVYLIAVSERLTKDVMPPYLMTQINNNISFDAGYHHKAFFQVGNNSPVAMEINIPDIDIKQIYELIKD